MTTAYAPKVTVDSRGSQLLILRKGDPIPSLLHGLISRKGHAREIIRLAVGAKFIAPEIAAGIIPNFLEALKVYNNGQVVRTTTGSWWSGGTANQAADGSLKDDMPTVLPGHIAANFPTIAFSTTPKTAAVLAQNYINGGLVVDQWGTRLDFRQHLNLVYEPGITEAAPDWDFDVSLYLQLMKQWASLDVNPFRPGLIGANGGPVAADEFFLGLELGFPLILLKGSMRAADAAIEVFENDRWDNFFAGEIKGFQATKDDTSKPQAKRDAADASIKALQAKIAGYQALVPSLDRDLVSVATINDAKSLNTALLERGFLQAPDADEDDVDPNA